MNALGPKGHQNPIGIAIQFRGNKEISEKEVVIIS